mmetsp:Transcript_5169/g.9076  ORF Transcript_5169/g.9076 Transcript_5169/m.9076 type:complete len:241 (-) Transcript_5169:151-873(-)
MNELLVYFCAIECNCLKESCEFAIFLSSHLRRVLLLCLITVAFAFSVATQTSCAFMRFNDQGLLAEMKSLANKAVPDEVNDPDYVPGQMTFGLWKYDAGFSDSTCQKIYARSDVTWGGVLKVARAFGIMASIAGGFGWLVLLAEILFDPFATLSRPVVTFCVGLAGILQIFTFLYYFADVCWRWDQIGWICEAEQGTWFSLCATLFFLLGALLSILLSKEPPLLSSKTSMHDASLAANKE